MKKIAVTIALLALGFEAQAQSIGLGVKGGINRASLAGDLKNSEAIIGYHAGIFSEIRLAKIGIQPELLYSTQGTQSFSKTRSGVITKTEDEKLSLNYVNFNLMLKWYMVGGLYLEVGPQMSFLHAAKLSYEYKDVFSSGSSTTTNTNRGEKDLKKEINTSDFGVNAGFGILIANKIGLGARYNFGLDNVYRDSSTMGKANNSIFMLSVSYKFL